MSRERDCKTAGPHPGGLDGHQRLQHGALDDDRCRPPAPPHAAEERVRQVAHHVQDAHERLHVVVDHGAVGVVALPAGGAGQPRLRQHVHRCMARPAGDGVAGAVGGDQRHVERELLGVDGGVGSGQT